MIIVNENISLQVSDWKIEEVAFDKSRRPYSVLNIETRLISDVDTSGDVLLSIKADIRIQALSEEIYVTLQALDGEGFALESVLFKFYPAPSKNTSVSRRLKIPYANYMSINRWVLR